MISLKEMSAAFVPNNLLPYRKVESSETCQFTTDHFQLESIFLVLCRLRLQSCWKTIRKPRKQKNLWKESCIPEWMVKKLRHLRPLHLFQELTQRFLLFHDLTFCRAVGQGPAFRLGTSWKAARRSVPFPAHQRQR